MIVVGAMAGEGVLAADADLKVAVNAPKSCTPAGEWTLPPEKTAGEKSSAPQRGSATDVLANAARSSVVLLGETHDDADHHRWQLQTIAALAALHGRVVLGFESFPRRVQGALDRWVAGEFNEAEFLAASDWRRVWNFEPQLYLPLFHFARLNRVPMLALNVEAELVRAIGRGGLDAVPADRREGVGKAVPPSDAYRDRLFSAYAAHGEKGRAPSRSDPQFRRFVDSQQFWDRAMAEAIAAVLARDPKALVIGVMGVGHVVHGDGVQHQLAGLGVTRVTSLLPWDAAADCSELRPGAASAVFALPEAKAVESRPRLGIRIEPATRTTGTAGGVEGVEGVRITEVRPGSLADITGLRAGDVLVEAAGTVMKTPAELQAIVGSMAPGTWLPLKARREDKTLDLVTKFPPAAKQ